MQLFVLFLLVFCSITALSYCFNVLCICGIWWLCFDEFWHCILHSFPLYSTFMLLQLRKVVYRFTGVSYVHVLLGFDISFLRYSSADIGMTFMCPLILVIFIWSLSLLFCEFIPCGLLLHAPVWLHVSIISYLVISTVDPVDGKK